MPRTGTDTIRRYKFTLPKSEHSPGPITERGIYGFVVYVCAWIMFGIYLVWAIVPHSYLHMLGFTYLPSRFWAIFVPWFLVSLLFGGIAIYLKLNSRLVLPLSSIHLICDDTSSELSSMFKYSYSDPEFEARQSSFAFISEHGSMPPTLDLNHDWVCKQLYLKPQALSS